MSLVLNDQFLGNVQHFFFPIVRKRIDRDYLRSRLFGNDLRIATVKFRLHEDNTDFLFFTSVYQILEVGGRRLFTIFFDGNLMQTVVAGKVR